MSLLITQETKRFPRAYKLPHINLFYSEFAGISAKFKKMPQDTNYLPHLEYRAFFTRSCIERLDLRDLFASKNHQTIEAW